MKNNILTLRDAKKEFLEIKKAFSLKGPGTIKEPFKIDTKWGLYVFHFDEKCIFGRFENLKTENLPQQFQEANKTLFKLYYYPNLHSGKMNFHFHQIFDFIDTIERILKD